MDTAIIVGLIGAAGTVIAAVVSALLYRSRLGGVSAVPALPGTAVNGLIRLNTFRARLAVGLSALALVIGLAAACLAPGGWLKPHGQKPSSWEITQLTALSERLGFQAWTLVPLTGLGLALVGAVGLTVGWAASAPLVTRHAEPISGSPRQ